jgi:ferritin-like metal-binding protein YciE
MPSQPRLDELHERIQKKLDELHTDFKQLETDVRGANQASSRAHRDRIDGFKRALRDILQAANRADREWQ